MLNNNNNQIMLSSSDAKFRCLWHMFIWSITLTLVSQFYSLTDHVAFYVFGGLSIMVLPFVTFLYSTTSGRRGANWLRVAYVVCDPVIACMAVVPVLLLNKLSSLIHEMECLSIDMKSWKDTLNCLGNKSTSPIRQIAIEQKVDFSFVPGFWLERRNFLVAIEVSVVIPCVLALMMGRRSRKMYPTTPLITFSYWLITSIECVTLIETVLLCGSSRVDYAVTTEVTVCVACIVCNSYGMVTLCSYVSPLACRGDQEVVAARFNNVYKYLIGSFGVLFVEIPQLVARIQLIASTSDWPSFYESSYLYQGAYNHESSIHYSHHFKHSDDVFVMNSTFKNQLDPNMTSPMRADQLQHHPPMLPQSIINITHGLEDKSLIYKHHLPASFYIWGFKDAAMIVVIVALMVLQKYGRSPPIFLQIFGKGRGCAGVAFDNPDAKFIPEKRDKYIVGCSDYRDGAPKLDAARSSQRLIRADSQDDSCKKNVRESNSNDRYKNKSNKILIKNYSDDTTNVSLNRNIVNMTIVSNSLHLENAAADRQVATTSTTENYNNSDDNNNKQSNDHQVTILDKVTNDKISGSGALINVTDMSTEMSLDQTRDPSLLKHRSSLDESAGERRLKKSVKFSFSEDKSETSNTSNENSNAPLSLTSALKHPSNLNNSSGTILDPSNIANNYNNDNNNINNNNSSNYNYNNNNGNTNYFKSVYNGKLNANSHSSDS
ncbi:hypothetical protein HELRODRAFT_190627 [Helobdella robusta]|uniref:Uncharacterized protein n=1 Tax=Helobdella robusta TaxID=6412 RepID=T1FS55_HELRO|nr:hypothetical protein HELRODRAFT_190627 [Helobdella robusta]ESO08825.1 hypothetical protein HELRODRAFT_190627 [Helobdella robusta]